ITVVYSVHGCSGAMDSLRNDLFDKGDLDWNESKEISRGGQGVVYRVPSRSGQIFAVKTRVSLDEIDRLKRLRHCNIVKFISVTTHNNRPALVMEYADRNLRKHLDRGVLGKHSFIDITSGIAAGLSYVHEQGLVHRDIKSENILIIIKRTDECVAKIGDFGIAREIPESWARHQVVGSYQYMAPELLVPERIEGPDPDAVVERKRRVAELEPRVDTWSFGCLSWECLTGLAPFVGCDPVTLPTMVAIGQNRIPLPHEVASESLWNMLERCLVIKPENRSSMPAIVEMLAGLRDDIQNMTHEVGY
ncbi:hypothetical protein PMAYCL1PPCAC_09634, partial [Pristionchus mayeri]